MPVLITYLLMVCPFDIPLPRHVDAKSPYWRALKQFALVREVTGPHERWIDDYRSEVRYVKWHLRDLKDCPPLCDADIFGSRDMAKTACCFWRQRRQWLEASQPVYLFSREVFATEIARARWLEDVTSAIESAVAVDFSWPARRKALQRLMERLGPEAYYAGVIQ